MRIRTLQVLEFVAPPSDTMNKADTIEQITVAFATQALLAIILSLTVVYHSTYNMMVNPGTDLPWSTSLKMKSYIHIVETIRKLQSLTGVALIIAALSQGDKLSLYHYHIIHDVVSFTGWVRLFLRQLLRLTARV